MKAREAHWLKNILYNQDFGLYDHFSGGKNEPFAAVRAFPEEDFIRESYFQDVCVRYYQNGIYDFFKMTLMQYMRLPMPYARELDRIAKAVITPMEREKKLREEQLFRQHMGNIPQGKAPSK